MMEKVKAFWSLFKTGESVANPQMWKKGQITATMVAAFLFAIVQMLRAFGYDFHIDMQMCSDIAVGVLGCANVVLTIITTKKLGVPKGAVRAPEQTVPSDAEATKGADEPMPPVSETTVQAGHNEDIGDDTRSRAAAWIKQHGVQFDNGLANDA